MFQATKEICAVFDNAEIKYDVCEDEDYSGVAVSVSSDIANLDIFFVSEDDDNDVTVRVFQLANFEESKTDKMLRVVNELNAEYRFLKFFVDTEISAISIQYDIPMSCESVGVAALEIFAKLIGSCDDFYSRIMKAIWAD